MSRQELLSVDIFSLIESAKINSTRLTGPLRPLVDFEMAVECKVSVSAGRFTINHRLMKRSDTTGKVTRPYLAQKLDEVQTMATRPF